MRKIYILAVAFLMFLSSAAFCQDTIIPADVVAKLQSITEKIRTCGAEDITPVDPTSKEQLPFKLLQGPPLNVTWDIKKSDSVIKPYYGVIEFVTYSRMWAPDDLMKKNKKLAELVNQHNLNPDSLKHRYVFEPVPNGEFSLTTMTEIGSDMKETTEPKTYRCWQLAADIAKTQ